MRRTAVLLTLALALGAAACSSDSDAVKSDQQEFEGAQPPGAVTTPATNIAPQAPDTSAPQRVTSADKALCSVAQTVANAKQANVGVETVAAAFAAAFNQYKSALSAPAQATLAGYDPNDPTSTANVNIVEQYNVWCQGQG